MANAGALAVLPVWIPPPEEVAPAIEETRRITTRSFGINIRAGLVQVEHVEAAIDGNVSIIHLLWGDPSRCMKPVRAAGARMIATVGDVEAARIALDAGPSALVAQGVEAGGHVLGEIPLRELIEAILPVAGEVPVWLRAAWLPPQT